MLAFFKTYKKHLISIFIFLLLVIGIFYGKLLIYGFLQAKGQLTIIYKTKPVEEILADETVADSVKNKLRFIQEIRKYAQDSLGINYSENYTTFYDQQNKPILWNVTACEKYELKPYFWRFPLLGRFSYKGFFDKERAEEEYKDLEKQDYDVNIYPVSGWSTLGFLKDPILSKWLQYSEGRLANLIIHELTHGTLYVKDNVDYNENLASFVGDEGAKRFLAYRFGANSPELTKYLQDQEDQLIFRQLVLQETKKLDTLYQQVTPENRETKKKEFMQNFVSKLTNTKFSNLRYNNYFEGELPNNTFFMGFVRYYDQQDIFKQEFQTKFNSDFKLYMQFLKKQYPHIL